MTTYLSLRNVQNFNTSTLTASTVIGSTINFTSNVLTLGPSAGATQSATLSNGTWSTWAATKTSMSNVKKIAVSSTGQYQLLLLTVAGTSALWLSSDSGATWSLCTAYGLPSGAAYSYTSAAISADGRYITIGVYGDLLYVSSDSGATFNNPQPGTAPYAWLRFENSFTDTMGNSTITPTIGGDAPTFSSTVVPNAGQAYSMRLTNTAGQPASQYVRGSWSAPANFTVSMWVNFQTLGAQQNFFSSYGGQGFLIYLQSTNYLTVYLSASIVASTSFAVTANTWYFVSASFVANGIGSFYVNNTLIGTYVCGSSPGTSSGLFSLGCNDNNTNTAFNGFIDDFRLTNSAITYQPVPLSPYAWLKFENAVTDTMGAVTPTVTGSVSYVPGVVGRSAVNLANTAGSTLTSGNYIRGAWNGSSNFTISFWFNPQSLGAIQLIFSAYSGSVQYYLNASNILTATFPNGGGDLQTTYSTPFAVTTNTWYHVTTVFQSSGTCAVYVNGVSIGSTTNSGGVGTYTTTQFSIGTYDNTNTYGFNGYIDDLRIYPFAVLPPNASTAQIMTLPSNWSQIALSGSGQYQLAGTDYGQVYKSTDYGATWTASTGANQAGSTGCVRNLALSHSGQYQLVNAQKWVTPNQSGLLAATWSQSGVTWAVSVSSIFSGGFPAFYLFNNNPANDWGSASAVYTSGVYTGSVSTTVQGGVGAVLGEWLQLQSSVPLVMSSYTLSCGGSSPTQMAKTYYIVGSTDNITWYPVQYANFTTTPFTTINTTCANTIQVNYSGAQTVSAGQAGSVTTTSYPTSTNAYTYFRLIVTNVYPTGALVNIGEFYPNFLAANTYTPQQTGLAANTWSVNGVTYTASASTTFSGYAPYGAFNNRFNNSGVYSWVSAAGAYNTTTGAYTGSTSAFTVQGGIGSVRGEWLQLQISIPMVLSSYTYACGGFGNLPKTGYILGSNDGTTWYPVQYFSYTTNPLNAEFTSCSTYLTVNYSGVQTIIGGTTGSVTTTAYSTTTNAYTYFRVVGLTNFGGVSYQYLEIGELYLNFLGGQSYSTNYGSTWTTVPTTYLAGPTAVSGNGQYQIGVNNTPLIARLTLDGTNADAMGGLTAAMGAGSVTYSTSIKQVGTHSAQFSNTAGVAPSVYLNYTVPTVLNQPSALTMACWVYPTSAGDTVPLCLTNAVTNYGPNFNLKATGQVNLNVWNTANSQTTTQSSTGAVSTNTWTHLVATIGNNTQSLYINGVLIGTTAFSGIIAANTGVTINNVLVGTGTSTSFAFAGYVDDVRLYTSALTAAQVAALYADPTSTVQSLAVTSNYLAGLSSTPSNPVTLANAAAIVDTATSYTGQYMIAVTAATSGSNVYYSTNYGATWTGLSVGLATAPLVSCAMSYDGTYATVASTTTVYTLNNNTTGYTLAIGAQAGQTNQASQAIAIGNKAGQTNQAASSIVLNATGSTLTACGPGFYVGPVAAYQNAVTGTTPLRLLGYGGDSQIVQTDNYVTLPSGNIQVGNAVDNIYPNNPLSSSKMVIFGSAPSNPTTSGTTTMSGTLFINSTDANGLNVGASVALGGRGYNFGGGSNHMTFARIAGVQATESGAYYGNFTIETQNSGALYERFRIDSGGAVYLKAYTTNGTIGTNSSGLIIAGSSDRRIKENIEYQTDTEAALTAINGLKPATFNFTNSPDKRLGFIAQDMETIIPLAVDGKKYEYMWETTEDGKPKFDEDGNIVYKLDANGERIIRPRGITDISIIAVQTLAIQELTKNRAAQQSTLTDHTATLAALQSTITALQAQVSTLVSSSAPAPSTSSDSTTTSSSSSDSTTASSDSTPAPSDSTTTSSSSSDSTTASSSSSDSTTAPSTSSDSTTAPSDSTPAPSDSTTTSSSSSDSTTASSDSTTTSSTQSV